MTRDNRNALIAAAWFMLVFGFGAFFLPKLVIAAGNISTILGGAVAVAFVAAFFGVLWLRGRSQRRKNGEG
jgi:membrane protein DedA with SNARE-associated domain